MGHSGIHLNAAGGQLGNRALLAGLQLLPALVQLGLGVVQLLFRIVKLGVHRLEHPIVQLVDFALVQGDFQLLFHQARGCDRTDAVHPLEGGKHRVVHQLGDFLHAFAPGVYAGHHHRHHVR